MTMCREPGAASAQTRNGKGVEGMSVLILAGSEGKNLELPIRF